MESAGPKISESFQAFLDDTDERGIAARLYVHVHPDGYVSLFEEGAETVTLQAAILVLEHLTERAKKVAGDN